MQLKATKKRNIILIVIIALFTVFTMFPIYWMVCTSFSSIADLYHKQSLLPGKLTLAGYIGLFRETNFRHYYLNSLIVSGLSTLIALPISFLGAFSLIRLKWRGQNFLKSIVLWTYVLPEVILVIPLYVILNSIHLLNSTIGLVLTFLIGSTPFCTWLLMGYFQGIPKELEDSAKIDGCNILSMIMRIILPVSAPGVVTAGIYAFNLSWALYLYPVVFITQESKQLLAPGIVMLQIGDMFPWDQIMAAGVLACLIPGIVYTIGQKYVVQGLTLGAVK
ncbi:MAG TPA: carbohydrate ABC transporter permease [Bacillota bacterium]